jgi:hypothetical protein
LVERSRIQKELVQKPAQKTRLGKTKNVFPLSHKPAAAAGCSNRRIMVAVGPNRWLVERSEPFHPQVIQTQMLSRVFVFTFSGEHYDAQASTGIVFS